MEWLNYHHLYYFWTVAREGSISKACDQLYVAQPTISAQIAALEKSLGDKLFTRTGRSLLLTDTGRLVYRYAEEIFSLGRELSDAVKGRPIGRPMRLVVGVADVLPKLVAYRLLEPAMRLTQPVQLICREGPPERLMAELSVYGLDLVLSDAPVGPQVKVRAFSHLLGESGISFFAEPKLAAAYRRGFPRSLHGAPFLLPSPHTSLRRSLDAWFEAQDVRPVVKAEFEDGALLKTFGQTGIGLFPASTVVENDVRRQYGVRLVGRTDAIREQFFAISVERRLRHPAVVALTEQARRHLFE